MSLSADFYGDPAKALCRPGGNTQKALGALWRYRPRDGPAEGVVSREKRSFRPPILQRESEAALQNLRLGRKDFRAYIEGVKENREKRPETSGLEEGKPEMFATLKRTAKLLRVPSQAERDMAYLNEAGDRYDLEARERTLSRRNLNRTLGL